MNLENLKEAWNTLNRKVEASQALNEKLIEKMFATRVTTNLEGIRKQYTSFYFVLTLEVIALTGILVGNPFDFFYWPQFIPFMLLLIGVVIAFLNLALLHRRITKLSSDGRVIDYLRDVVSVYDKNKRFERVFAVSLLTVGLSVPFAFLPKKIAAHDSIQLALLETAIPITISIVMFIVAHKLGLFRNRHKEKFASDLKEWEELRDLSNTLSEEG